MIYLDNAATTKPNQDVLDTFLKVNQTFYFNPSSPHKAGVQAEQLLVQAKQQINELLELNNKYDIVFTSGATESNNIALQGIAKKKKAFAPEIITSVLEHPSVLEVVRALGKQGFDIKFVDINSDGRIDLEHLKSLMSDKVGLVTCMHVNNIMGQVQPIAEIGRIVKAYPKAHFHVDAVQAIGKVPLEFEGVHSLSMSGHKFNGLKGQGVLLVENVHQIEPIMQGGGQELGIRSGTINLPINISIVKAIKYAIQNQALLHEKLASLNSELRTFVKDFKGVYINSPKDAAPHVLNIAFPGVKGEVLVNAFSKHNVLLSTTSACASKKAELNEVLLGMGVSKSNIEGSIRLSLGVNTTSEDIAKFKEVFIQVYEEVKELLK
ncbi:cysteine desulfurase [Staphylococcus sp. 18_1_E_LY]|uniref:Cysteine desulfurase n=1 Tax=Staphylococcus lloydii TaxID=2781774 RepID=A0A7T1FAC4_9STAP|nr:cysteine desulfurase family protein [Staphylococcus lloydii]MBF7018438.1 cysteine desulfurase [Staphylococcus lloydii]MBF7026166.1 cysteine desulfurase [Staphylococcus lloydii]QPM76187.1 cysteine desulfurase [Staphylococcus lloydii]